MEFANRMEMNMYQEAKLYINNGVELPSRNPEGTARREVYIQQELQKYEAIHGVGTWKFKSKKLKTLIPWTTSQRSNIKKNLQNELERLKEDVNVSADEVEAWLDYAEGLYEITADFIVNSYAKTRGPNKSWQCQSEAHAEDLIAQHIIWISFNRRRNRGSVDADLSGVKELK